MSYNALSGPQVVALFVLQQFSHYQFWFITVKTSFTHMNVSESAFQDGFQSISSHKFNGSMIEDSDVNTTQVEHADLLLRVEANVSGVFACEACNKLTCERQSILIQEEGERIRRIWMLYTHLTCTSQRILSIIAYVKHCKW